MLYILWAILNTGIFFYFLYLLIFGWKIIREKLGLFAAVVFVFGLLAFHSHENNKQAGSNEVQKWKFSPEENLAKSMIYTNDTDMDKTVMFRFNLGYQYGIDTVTKKYVPIEAYSFTPGVQIGTVWRPITVEMEQTADNQKFKYKVWGTLEWSLLGYTIYVQEKTFEGLAPVK